MSNLNNLTTIISNIQADAMKKINNALIERAAVINSFFDDAYGSCIGGYYASGMQCVAEGLKYLDEMLEYADDVMSTADGVSWECVRDALGSIKMEKAPLQQAIVDEYNKRIKRYVSPTFGDSPRRYIVEEKNVTIESEGCKVFERDLENGTLVSATLDTLGATYYYDKGLHRWVLDSLINIAVQPWMAKYMK